MVLTCAFVPEESPSWSLALRRCFKISKWIIFSYNLVTYETATFALSPGISESVHEPIQKVYLRFPQLSQSPGCKPHWFPEPDIFGVFLSLCMCHVLGRSVWVTKPSLFGRSATPVRSLPIVCCQVWGFLVRQYLCLSYPSLCGFFTSFHGGSSSLSCPFILSGNYFICSCRFHVMVWSEFRVFLYCHIGPEHVVICVLLRWLFLWLWNQTLFFSY